ncbi:Polygalacturonase qrt3 [Stylosanthes scabra]|uniref:Polygalacturonase qrt3 n=1 Tax=Stylosanthes scabra TaxID=79078 RepID=A0ABU6T5U4_9FABA|nr:Polygalacturonase qrt3 [Stylosanthes scabra]
MARTFLLWFLFLGVACGGRTINGANNHYLKDIRRLQAFKASLTARHGSVAASFSSSFVAPSPLLTDEVGNNPRVYHVTSYGADPTGNSDSTEALIAAIADAAAKAPSQGQLMQGITDLGGAHIDLEGGNYLISRPLRFPVAGVGNLMIHGGTIRASKNFPEDGYIIDLSSTSSSSSSSNNNNYQNRGANSESSHSSPYNFEYISFKDLLLDSNFRGGGISVINSLRTSIDNCYITHFTTNGILVQSGHETYIRNTFLGQHVTAGGDKNEKNFSGTGISLLGNDNAVTDVVIFSAAVGIMVTGQANTFSGVHCYNKATGFGGTGIYLRLPGLTQTRIVNSYMDYTSIVAEDPVQLHVSSSFFLGDANIVLKSVNGVVNGISIVDNMFSGSGSGVEIVQLDQSSRSFKQIDQAIVDRNIVRGMNLKATVAKMSIQGNGTLWNIDFNSVLLFPNLIRNVQYSVSSNGGTFPNHALRDVSENKVVIETSEAVNANVFVTVDQSMVYY